MCCIRIGDQSFCEWAQTISGSRASAKAIGTSERNGHGHGRGAAAAMHDDRLSELVFRDLLHQPVKCEPQQGIAGRYGLSLQRGSRENREQ